MMNRLSVLLSLLVLACKPAPQTTGNVIPAPSHPAAVLNGETGATLTWQHADGSVAGYYVFLQKGAKPVDKTGPEATSYAFRDLAPGTAYTFGVQAIGTESNSLSPVVYAEPLLVPIPQDPDELPEISDIKTSYAYLAATWKVVKALEKDAEAGLCWSGDHDPTLADAHLAGPAWQAGKDILQVIPNAVLDPGKTYRIRAYVRYADKTLYGAVREAALEAQPEPIPLTWQKIASPASGIEVYETTAPLQGRKFHAWYAVADCRGDIEFRVLNPTGKQTLEQQAATSGDCYVLINGGIYGTKHIGVVIADGTPQAWRDEVDGCYWAYDSKLYSVTRGFFGVDRSGKPAAGWTSAPSENSIYFYPQPLPTVMAEAAYPLTTSSMPCKPSSWTPWQAISTGPLVLHDGKVTVDRSQTAKGYYYTNYDLWPEDVFPTHPDRTAVGCTADGKIVLFICDGRLAAESQGAYLDELARIMKGLGCTEALNLDGGGSTAMIVGGNRLNSKAEDGKEPYNRPVLSTLGFFRKR